MRAPPLGAQLYQISSCMGTVNQTDNCKRMRGSPSGRTAAQSELLQGHRYSENQQVIRMLQDGLRPLLELPLSVKAASPPCTLQADTTWALDNLVEDVQEEGVWSRQLHKVSSCMGTVNQTTGKSTPHALCRHGLSSMPCIDQHSNRHVIQLGVEDLYAGHQPGYQTSWLHPRQHSRRQ